jgi:opacity protein-like surface antigen
MKKAPHIPGTFSLDILPPFLLYPTRLKVGSYHSIITRRPRMKMNRYAFAVVAIAALLTSPTLAADNMPGKAPVAAPSWTGLYVGLNGGYGWGNADYAFAIGGSGDGGNLFSPNVTGGSFDRRLDGGIFGGHAGFNYQVGKIVTGLEASFDWSGLSGSSTNPFAPIVPGRATYDTELKWLATITPRLGYAVSSNWLPYVKGGMAAGRVRSTLKSSSGFSFSDGNDHIGWTVGAGIEYAWRNWIVGLEYNYNDLGHQHYGGEVFPNTKWPLDYTVHPTFSTVLGRVSYKWGVESPTHASDMSTKAPGAATSWTGLYVGLNGGYGWGNAEYAFAIGGSGLGGGNLFSPNVTGGSFDRRLDGGIFGGHAGFNYQVGKIVAGLEASFDWSGLSGSSTNHFAPTVPGKVTYDTELKYLTTVTPRLGYAFSSNWLPYVKGGLAAGRVRSKLRSSSGFSFSDGNDHIGWTVGGGIEYAWGSWIVGLEYNYHDLGRQYYGGEVTPNTTWPLDYNVRPTFSTVLGRVSYKFN